MPDCLWGPRSVDKWRHSLPHPLTQPPCLSASPLSLCAPKCDKRVSSLPYSNLRFSTKAAECWPALLHPLGTALFIYGTVTRLMNSRCGFYGLETYLSEMNLNCPHRPISHMLPNNRWQGCRSFPSLSQRVTYKTQGLLSARPRTDHVS